MLLASLLFIFYSKLMKLSPSQAKILEGSITLQHAFKNSYGARHVEELNIKNKKILIVTAIKISSVLYLFHQQKSAIFVFILLI